MTATRRFRPVRFLVILIAVILAGGLAGIFPFHQIIASDRAIALAERQLDALVEENRRLEQQVVALASPEEVERLAREHFGLVMPGEIGFVSVPSPGPEVDTGPDTYPGGEQRAWWQRVWDFLTGRDLADDERP